MKKIAVNGVSVSCEEFPQNMNDFTNKLERRVVNQGFKNIIETLGHTYEGRRMFVFKMVEENPILKGKS